MKPHSPQFLRLVSEAKSRINEISAKELKEKIDQHEKILLIDVREDNEWASGHIPTAIHLSKGIIERDIEKIASDPNTPIALYCSGGFRCALAADYLQNMGYTQVFSLDKGSQGWIDEGYPLVLS